uniref:Uncharacterized protein n=1 Tax=Melopsittacus undulatus TaxID=13146 RepID=A0A8V5H2N4_MELUD
CAPFLDAEGYLADGLQHEKLSAKAKEQRDAILFGFQQVKARFETWDFQCDAGFGQDSSDENQSWAFAPSMASDASLPSDFQDEVFLRRPFPCNGLRQLEAFVF